MNDCIETKINILSKRSDITRSILGINLKIFGLKFKIRNTANFAKKTELPVWEDTNPDISVLTKKVISHYSNDKWLFQKDGVYCTRGEDTKYIKLC